LGIVRRLVIASHCPGEHQHPDHYRRIGDVEFWPDPDSDEVDDVPEPHPIDDIAQCAANEQSETHRQNRRRSPGADVRPDERRDNRAGNERQDDTPAFEDAKRGARVLNVLERQQRPDHLEPVRIRIPAQGPGRERLGHLIDRDGDSGYGNR
jgi:hypothetical protein